jgi:hypothetical protein
MDREGMVGRVLRMRAALGDRCGEKRRQVDPERLDADELRKLAAELRRQLHAMKGKVETAR